MAYGGKFLEFGKKMALVALDHRALIQLQGQDKASFLQGLITQDVGKIQEGKAVYGALLTPQGKFLHDLFLMQQGDSWFIDCERARVTGLLKRLNLYKLRSKITLTDCSEKFKVLASFPTPCLPNTFLSVQDPRHKDLGWRFYVTSDHPLPTLDSFDLYDQHRIALTIPDGSRDLPVEKAIVLEYGFDDLGALDWQKGCYIGQELMARTHYRGLIRKKLICVNFDQDPPPFGTTVILPDGTEGEVRSTFGSLGLVLQRFN